MRGCPYWNTSSTADMETITPSATIHPNVVYRGALPHTEQQQPGNGRDDQEGGHVDQDRDAGDVGRGLEQTMHGGVGGEERRSVSRREPYRKLSVEAPEQRREIVRPGDRHGDVADGVLEDQVPPDDPRDQLSQGRIRVGVGAPRLRDHGGQLGVAQTGERAAYTEQQERQD